MERDRLGSGAGSMTAVDYGVTVQELAIAARTKVTTENQPFLEQAIWAAAQEADSALDCPDLTVLDQLRATSLGHQVVLARAVEWVKASDSAFGVVGFSDVGALRAPTDGFSRHASALLPMRQRFGLA